MTQIRVFRLLLSVLFLVFTTRAHATDSDRAAAEQLFQKGRQAMGAHDFETACNSFAESQRLEPAAGTLMNWATCEEKLGKVASAWEHWQQAMQLLPKGDRRGDFARQRVEVLEKDLPQLVVRLAPSAPSSIRVFRNGTEIGKASLGQPFFVDPGAVEVRTSSPRHEERVYRTEAKSGETTRLEVNVGAERKDVDPSPGRTQRILGGILWGVGAAGIATLSVTAALLPGRQATVADHCEQSTRTCDATGLAAADEGQALLAANTAGWIAAGAGLVAGTIVFFTAPSEPGKPTAFVRADVAGAAVGLSGGF